jgi:histidinol dehydrogenase
MKIIRGIEKARKILTRQGGRDFQYTQEPAVRRIINDVRRRGDAAVFEYTEKFDSVKLEKLEVSRREITAAVRKVDRKLLSALELAAERIATFHRVQKQRALQTYTHGKTGWIVRPLEKAGVYAPGGTASYPSTVLMSAIPAKMAGVKEIVLVTPPGKNGKVPPVTLVAASIAGVDRIFSVGGAQAIAGLAFGTESVPRVDKIFGPGNIYIFLAKKLLYGIVGIDGLWGPSEVIVIADEAADPDYCASDLLAQSEHGGVSQQSTAILITTSRQLADKVIESVQKQLETLSRKEIIERALEENGVIIIVRNMEEAIELTNLYAPEHVLLQVRPGSNYNFEETIIHAGCIIHGQKGTVPISDYVSGPSHVLPTGGTARFFSPLNVTDFMKITNLSSVGDALMNLAGEAAITIAKAEGLDAHARAVELRLKNTRKNKLSSPSRGEE